MRIADALELLSWPLALAKAATAGLGARVNPVARLVSRRLGRGRAEAPSAREERAPPGDDLRSRAEAARFWLGAAPVVGAADAAGPGPLPEAYGRDYLVLVARDPWWLFAFWEITPATQEQARATLGAEAGGAATVLRLTEDEDARGATNGAAPSLDVEIAAGAHSWYVNVGRPATAYRAEIGLRTASGRFVPLARSNVVRTPRATPSAETELRQLVFGPTGPAWSPDQRQRGAAADDRGTDDRPAPGS